jgi:uncharacterized phage-associated protein
MNIKKVITVLNYIARQIGPVDKLKAVKLLYFIDKRHFIQYGRFVTNDCYIKMPLGPVPSRVLDVIDNPDIMLGKAHLDYLRKNISIDMASNSRTINSLKEPDIEELSKSEITIIDQVIAEYGEYPTPRLVDLTHLEKAWINAGDLEELSIEDMLDGVDEDRKRELLGLYKDSLTTNKAFHAIMV